MELRLAALVAFLHAVVMARVVIFQPPPKRSAPGKGRYINDRRIKKKSVFTYNSM